MVTDQKTSIQSSLRKIQLGIWTNHNAPNHHGLRTQLFPACTARGKQQSGIFTQWTLFNPGGGSAQRGPRSEKTLQVKSRLTRHGVLDSSFGKKNIRRTVLIVKTFDITASFKDAYNFFCRSRVGDVEKSCEGGRRHHHLKYHHHHHHHNQL